MLRDLRSQLGATEDVPTVTTGWGRKLLPAVTNVTKISCHARGVHAGLGMGGRWGLLNRFSSATQCGRRSESPDSMPDPYCSPTDVAKMIVQAIREDRFWLLPNGAPHMDLVQNEITEMLAAGKPGTY